MKTDNQSAPVSVPEDLQGRYDQQMKFVKGETEVSLKCDAYDEVRYIERIGRLEGAPKEERQRFWKEDVFPIINAIGELSVQEAMDAIEKHFGVSHV